tara:strand:+ start:832 stop:1203 length:372 start_codon:yes stop_codon:yes gene_type:complete
MDRKPPQNELLGEGGRIRKGNLPACLILFHQLRLYLPFSHQEVTLALKDLVDHQACLLFAWSKLLGRRRQVEMSLLRRALVLCLPMTPMRVVSTSEVGLEMLDAGDILSNVLSEIAEINRLDR